VSSERNRMSVGSFNQAWAKAQPYGLHLLVHFRINNVMSRPFVPWRPLYTFKTIFLSFTLIPLSFTHCHSKFTQIETFWRISWMHVSMIYNRVLGLLRSKMHNKQLKINRWTVSVTLLFFSLALIRSSTLNLMGISFALP